MTSSVSFGLWLRRRRMALGLTHAALAERAHCSVSALRKIEGDERRPSHRLAERLAACLQVPAAEQASLVEIARGDRRIDRLRELSAVELPPPETLAADQPAAVANAADAATRTTAPFDAATPSIAVLPFVNLSDDAANEHFADGLAEELLNVLAKIPGLRVASRTSAFSFKGNKDVDVPTMARTAQRARSSKEACASRASACASPRSSSRRRAIHTCGRRPTTGSWTNLCSAGRHRTVGRAGAALRAAG